MRKSQKARSLAARLSGRLRLRGRRLRDASREYRSPQRNCRPEGWRPSCNGASRLVTRFPSVSSTWFSKVTQPSGERVIAAFGATMQKIPS